jgi:hypothetical protein
MAIPAFPANHMPCPDMPRIAVVLADKDAAHDHATLDLSGKPWSRREILRRLSPLVRLMSRAGLAFRRSA